MTDVEYKNSLYELNEIFKILDKSLIEKIPQGLKNIIANEKATNYDFSLDYSKRLSEQKLSETTELFLTALHLKYWCNGEEKQEILNTMNNNEIKYQEELREQYNPDDIFKNRNRVVAQEEQQSEETRMTIIQEEKWYQKIFNIIKSLFKRR